MTELPEMTTFVMNQDSSVTLTCQVECDPVCDIQWSMVGDDETDVPEDVIRDDEVVPEDKDQFSSVKSSLTIPAETIIAFNLENFTVECVSGENDFGESVSSTTVVVIECRKMVSTKFVTVPLMKV